MLKTKLIVQSKIPHNSQIITGFLRLKALGYPVEIEDQTRNADVSMKEMPFLSAVSAGGTLIYDLGDGYNAPDAMMPLLENCDVYFKRSFSAEKNAQLFPEYQHKMQPLGFNYHVTCRGNPINEPLWKHMAKPLFGRTPDRYFVPEVFEGSPRWEPEKEVTILFLTRLWDDHEPTFSREDNAERTYINQMRIEIIRSLRKQYGNAFFGGLNDHPLSRQWAPDLIVPAKYTERKRYLKLLHSSDICIGSMGLFESIGWKTGEYVAAAKGIVNERLRYSVPGNYEAGLHYLSFETTGECIRAVQQLVNSPEQLYAMKKANEAYYQAYLKPEVLVKNSLEQAEKILSEKK